MNGVVKPSTKWNPSARFAQCVYRLSGGLAERRCDLDFGVLGKENSYESLLLEGHILFAILYTIGGGHCMLRWQKWMGALARTAFGGPPAN